jgi:hypothetical protein
MAITLFIVATIAATFALVLRSAIAPHFKLTIGDDRRDRRLARHLGGGRVARFGVPVRWDPVRQRLSCASSPSRC